MANNIVANARKLAEYHKNLEYKSKGPIDLVRFNYKPDKVSFKDIINREEYKNSLFLFNDNVSQFEDYYYYKKNTSNVTIGKLNGAGNACIRSWQCLDKPRAAGIPTGSYSKYKKNISLEKISPLVVNYTSMAMENIKDILEENKDYTRVIYSGTDKNEYQEASDNLDVDLFSGIIGEDVRWYIVGRMRDLVDEINASRIKK